ncbi:ribonuclease Z [Candidatus Pacearchaeota archaeon]|nr:ribonuclease Z [Candidatus Pacearchaeota archaeon]
MIKLTFLGTADSIPSASRNPTSILLTYNQENILIDCGEGTQRQFRKARLNPCKITRLLITHWHGDHVLGIPGLLQTLALSGYNKTLFIYGPKGTKTFMKNLLDVFVFRKQYQIKVEEISGKFFEVADFYLESKGMTHGIPCNAYSFVKKGQIRIDKKKLTKSKLPSGPLLQKLKQGKDVTYQGKKYLAKNLTFKEEDKKVSFVLDTSLNKQIIPFVKDSDLLICESNFDPELKDRAKEYKHLTSDQAGNIAKKSNSKKLILTHISQRYDRDPKKILNGAKKIFKNSFLVKDLDIIKV